MNERKGGSDPPSPARAHPLSVTRAAGRQRRRKGQGGDGGTRRSALETRATGSDLATDLSRVRGSQSAQRLRTSAYRKGGHGQYVRRPPWPTGLVFPRPVLRRPRTADRRPDGGPFVQGAAGGRALRRALSYGKWSERRSTTMPLRPRLLGVGATVCPTGWIPFFLRRDDSGRRTAEAASVASPSLSTSPATYMPAARTEATCLRAGRLFPHP